MGNFTVRIDDDLLEEMKKFDDVNWSEDFRQFVKQKLEEKRRLELTMQRGFSWRSVAFKDNTVTVNAKLGEFGPTDWSLEIRSEKLERPLTVELGGMVMLERIIEGVADYFYHRALSTQGVDLTKVLSADVLCDLWLDVAKWARKNNLELSAAVALLPTETISVNGKCGQTAFEDTILPKKWENVRMDDDTINVFFSNLWLGSYAHTHGTAFRLSSYLAREYGISSAKNATRYVDFNPSDDQDIAEIRKLFSRASVVYLPDVLMKNVRSVFFSSETPKETVGV